MIHILSEGRFGMPDVEGESFYSTSSTSASTSFGEKIDTVISGPTDLPMIHLAGGGLAIPAGEPLEGARGSDDDLRQRAQRARLSAGVACLWAGIGVGAMLCGDTAEATLHYAENAREAIKGCYDVVSEEVRGVPGISNEAVLCWGWVSCVPFYLFFHHPGISSIILGLWLSYWSPVFILYTLLSVCNCQKLEGFCSN